jgi:hypothetical protein
VGITCGEEWASSLDKIIAGRSNVYARDLDVIWPTSPPCNNLTKKVRRIILELSNRQLRSFYTLLIKEMSCVKKKVYVLYVYCYIVIACVF